VNGKDKMQISLINRYLLYCDPNKYAPIYLVSIEDIFDNRPHLGYLKYNTNNSIRLINLLCDYFINEKRNKKSLARDCLYKIIKNSDNIPTDPIVIDKLFVVFKHYSLKTYADQWKIALFLKDMKLRDEQIIWLINNYNNNLQIENRVLRYPYPNNSLKDWAKDMLKKYSFNVPRASEILSLALDENTFSYFLDCGINASTLSSALFHSKILEKHPFLLQLLHKHPTDLSISRTALRLNYCDIIEKQKIYIEN
jgi:hypothetical protein